MTGLAADSVPPRLDVRRWLPPDVNGEPELAQEEVLVAPTAEEIVAIQEAARRAGAEAGQREGYAAGYEEGRAQAAREAAAEAQARAAREETHRLAQEQQLIETVGALEALALTLADPLASTAESLEPELLALVEALARRVILAELESRPELVARVLHAAMAQLPSRKHPLRVQVHPDQQAILETYAQTHGERITWVPEPALEPGGCILEAGPSRIDATLDARLRQAVDAIWGEVARPAPASLPEPAPDLAGSAPEPCPEPGAGLDAEPVRPLDAESAPLSSPAGSARSTPEPEPDAESDSELQSQPRDEEAT